MSAGSHLEPHRLYAADLEIAEEEHLAACIKCRAERRVGMRELGAREPHPRAEVTYLVDISGRSVPLADALPPGIHTAA